jgi:hypothetical protein
LEGLQAEAFDLESEGSDYIIRIKGNEPSVESSRQRDFLKNIVEEVWGPLPPDLEVFHSPTPAQLLRYTPSDIERLETEERSKRGNPNAMPDAQRISQVLRVIGDYLNQKHARVFAISWVSNSVSVTYETTEGRREREKFTVATLYERAVHMYSRRSSRDK